jgi:anti-sigma factor RsiW
MTTTSALTCQELVELVTQYLDGTLALADRERVDAHLGICQGCEVYLDQMRTIITLTGGLTEASIPTEAREDLLRTFRDWKREQERA